MPATERFSEPRAGVLVGILTLVAGALTLESAAADQAALWQSPESIRDAARSFVQQSLGANSATTVEVVAVDERLKLPVCPQPLQTHSQGTLRNGQGTVAVSCGGPQPWRLFVPVRAFAQVEVLIARRSVQAGEVLAAADLASSLRSSASLPYEYLTGPEQALGLTVRRTIPAGTVLVPGALDHPQLIERGALVTLVSGAGAVVVKTEGVALEAAKLKQRVRVRSQSGRIVEGVAEAANQVRVGS
ncbi:MAG TPA: flagellar basal body P-ring formation chaperone FlgA [Gammaproteobacteria bacterium]|nr:flagellar basal body P-ring formation chaperone FlgA [Gammaproteobacteria bacterium]